MSSSGIAEGVLEKSWVAWGVEVDEAGRAMGEARGVGSMWGVDAAARMSGDELGGAVRAAAEAEAEERCLRRGSGVLGVVLLITDYREQRLDQIGRWWLVEEMRAIIFGARWSTQAACALRVFCSRSAEMEGWEGSGRRAVASLASVSAHSLPRMPSCPGLQW